MRRRQKVGLFSRTIFVNSKQISDCVVEERTQKVDRTLSRLGSL